MRAHQAENPVATQCRVLGISTSGYYAWLKRGRSKRSQEDGALLETIESIHRWSRGTYGSPRMQAELKDRGSHVGRKRVARLMAEAGLAGVSRRRGVRTTIRDPVGRRAPDLVERKFEAKGPNELWVADITYVPTWAGFLYLAVVLDVWSRKIVGWAMETHLRTELVLAALEMGRGQRRPPPGLIHHSDQGCQYSSIGFGARCTQLGVRPSMGSVGDAYDNAMCESFFASLECELLDRSVFRTQQEARREIFKYIEGWYNPHRRHSSLGQLSPHAFEARHALSLSSVDGNLPAAAVENASAFPTAPWTAPTAPPTGSNHCNRD